MILFLYCICGCTDPLCFAIVLFCLVFLAMTDQYYFFLICHAAMSVYERKRPSWSPKKFFSLCNTMFGAKLCKSSSACHHTVVVNQL